MPTQQSEVHWTWEPQPQPLLLIVISSYFTLISQRISNLQEIIPGVLNIIVVNFCLVGFFFSLKKEKKTSQEIF